MRNNKGLFLIVIVLICLLSIVSCSQVNKIKHNLPDKSSEPRYGIEEKLYGIWQYGSREIGAGYNHIYIFNEDGTYKFQYSQYDGESREKGHSGEWKVLEDKIHLTVKNKTILEGGILSEASGSVSSEKEIVGGEIKEIYLSPPEKLEYTISDYNDENGTVKIDGEEFWSLDPKYYDNDYSVSNKRIKMDDLLEDGLEVIEEQSDEIELSYFGKVRFISGYKDDQSGIPKAYFYLVDKEGYVKYSFPEFYGNNWVFLEIDEIAFYDINKDGLKDIIIISEYILGHGEKAAEPFKIAGVYFQYKNSFVNMEDIDKYINDTQNNNSVDDVVKFLNRQNIELIKN